MTLPWESADRNVWETLGLGERSACFLAASLTSADRGPGPELPDITCLGFGQLMSTYFPNFVQTVVMIIILGSSNV